MNQHQQEDFSVAQGKSVNVNWLTVNVPSVVTMLLVGIGTAMYVQSLASSVDELKRNSDNRARMVDKILDQITNKLVPLDVIPYRLSSTENALIATNQRMDTYLQGLGVKIDGVSERVNGLTTKVEVLSQKIDTITPTNPSPSPTNYRP